MPQQGEEYFTISIVAKRFDIHPQTLRVYEREGLLSPDRSEGNRRLYSRGDVERIQTILNLTRELGVNLAGVDIILRLKKEIDGLEREKEEMRQRFLGASKRGPAKQTLVPVRRGKPARKGS